MSDEQSYRNDNKARGITQVLGNEANEEQGDSKENSEPNSEPNNGTMRRKKTTVTERNT